MNGKPDLSLIVPVYNVAPWLRDCLESVAAQGFPGKLECLVVDDCGTDESMAVAEDFLSGYNGPVAFRVLKHDANRGLSAARNTALDAAEGEYVFFLDGDDLLPSGALETLWAALGRERYDVVSGRFRFEGGTLAINSSLPDGSVLRDASVAAAYARGEWPSAACNKLYRRDFLCREGLRFAEGLLHEDELWSFEIAALCRSFAICGAETYLYRLRGGSITTAGTQDRKIEALQRIFVEIRAFVTSRGLDGCRFLHDKEERLRQVMFRMLLDRPQYFREAYLRQRHDAPKAWAVCVRADGFRLRRLLRDFHFALSPRCGAAWMRSRLLCERFIKSLSLCRQ